jgi:hypothetical protein
MGLRGIVLGLVIRHPLFTGSLPTGNNTRILIMILIEPPSFAPLVSTCAAHGICRSVAFKLAATGNLETFLIGQRRYVMLDSLKNLRLKLNQRSSLTRSAA